MIVTRTFFSVNNTIVRGNPVNLSINPVLELNYGGGELSRILFKFDVERLKCLVEDKTYPDISKLKHRLVMYNCASLDYVGIDKPMMRSNYNGVKRRASSFDIIFFLIPEEWDGGRGFDYVRDLSLGPKSNALSVYGSSWYNAKSHFEWQTGEGIFTSEKLSKEYDKFSSQKGNQSKIIFARQHFQYGNEQVDLDITEIVNKFITGELPNNGIGMAFTPRLELSDDPVNQYVGFFGKFTNSFYEPFVETTYTEHISDDRNDFFLDKENKIYFYSNIGGNPTNLDELPTCSLEDGTELEVKQATKGVYYASLQLDSELHEEKEMHYDTWSNLKYKGKKLKDVELSFVTKPYGDYFQFDNVMDSGIEPKKYVPTIKGIQYNEKIARGDIRKLIIEARIPYTTDEMEIIDDMEYRVYVMDGTKEMDVIGYQPVEKTSNGNFFLLNTNDLLPQRYYIDVKMVSNLEVKHFKKILSFDIVNDLTETYR